MSSFVIVTIYSPLIFTDTTDPTSDFQAGAVETAIEYMEAWGRRDSRGVANCYAEDGMFLVPGRDVLKGRKGVYQAFHTHWEKN